MKRRAIADPIVTALAAAKARLEDASAKHQRLHQQMVDLNAQGVELERVLLGIQGEITALEGLKG